MLDRPAEADPAGLAELVLPRDAIVEADVLVAGTAAALQLGELADDVLGEPRGDVARKRSSSSVSSTSAMVRRPSSSRQGHELDAHTVGVGQEQEVDARAGARLLDHGGAAVDEVLRGRVEVVD